MEQTVDESLGPGGATPASAINEQLAESRWEKGVEFALARTLQAWYIDDQLSSRRLTLEELPDAIRSWAIAPRYIPLDGNAEKALGDAIAGAKQLLLIECKKNLDTSGRAREAYAPMPPAGSSVEVQPSAAGGKNRLKVLRALHNRGGELRGTGENCHLLVGMHEFPAAPGDDPKSTPRKLAMTGYWPFIIGKNGEDVCVVDPKPICDAKNMGVGYRDFLIYLLALFEDESGNWSDDAAWLAQEVIILAHISNPDDKLAGWIGVSATRQALRLILDQDPACHALLDAAMQRQAAAKGAKPRSGPN